MLSEFRSLNLKLCSKQYNKNFLLNLIVAPQLSNITTQPKQSRSAAPMSSLFILKSVTTEVFVLMNKMYFLNTVKKVETIINLYDYIIFLI